MSRQFNLTTSVGSLLQKAGLSMSAVQKRGGILYANFQYDCNLDATAACNPVLVVQQIDNFNDAFIVCLQRLPSGKMSMGGLRIPWL